MSAIKMFFTVLCLLSSFSSLAADLPTASLSADLLKSLQKGGYALYIRHGATDTSRPDRVPKVDLADCMTQRPLSDAGRQMATRIGRAIRALDIPIAEVLVSPFCRTKETAQFLALGRHEVDGALMASSNAVGDEIPPLLRDFRALLARPIPAGSNRALVAHSTVLMDATGIFLKPEGTTLIVKPDGKGGFEAIAAVKPEDWDSWAARTKR